ncbi:hypothetical protein [Salipiger mucosus]|uniref:Uncharacterized protein n=1 Tax=Salipiger mucosus DSM 16094 TaxID=1123237 RepID=S9QSP7_9RHOB|nr:hypothetical protein [Salipiger mucosus]EPX82607.1 hypothetical protein Salmuc_00926 [Salipiger mucosus DSM 16094]
MLSKLGGPAGFLTSNSALRDGQEKNVTTRDFASAYNEGRRQGEDAVFSLSEGEPTEEDPKADDAEAELAERDLPEAAVADKQPPVGRDSRNSSETSEFGASDVKSLAGEDEAEALAKEPAARPDAVAGRTLRRAGAHGMPVGPEGSEGYAKGSFSDLEAGSIALPNATERATRSDEAAGISVQFPPDAQPKRDLNPPSDFGNVAAANQLAPERTGRAFQLGTHPGDLSKPPVDIIRSVEVHAYGLRESELPEEAKEVHGIRNEGRSAALGKVAGNGFLAISPPDRSLFEGGTSMPSESRHSRSFQAPETALAISEDGAWADKISSEDRNSAAQGGKTDSASLVERKPESAQFRSRPSLQEAQDPITGRDLSLAEDGGRVRSRIDGPDADMAPVKSIPNAETATAFSARWKQDADDRRINPAWKFQPMGDSREVPGDMNRKVRAPVKTVTALPELDQDFRIGMKKTEIKVPADLTARTAGSMENSEDIEASGKWLDGRQPHHSRSFPSYWSSDVDEKTSRDISVRISARRKSVLPSDRYPKRTMDPRVAPDVSLRSSRYPDHSGFVRPEVALDQRMKEPVPRDRSIPNLELGSARIEGTQSGSQHTGGKSRGDHLPQRMLATVESGMKENVRQEPGVGGAHASVPRRFFQFAVGESINPVQKQAGVIDAQDSQGESEKPRALAGLR